MKLSRLKPLRVAVSILFFTLTALLFLDFRNFGVQSVAGEVLYLQFVPSLLKFLNAAALGAAGFIFILILTVLFGRVYCSTVCPLGIFQDAVGFLARKHRKRPRYRYAVPHNLLRYAILAVTVLLMIAGSGLLLNLLDPFSSFGRIFSNLVRPVVLALNNAAASVLEPAGIHFLYRVRWAVFAPVSVGVAAVSLMTVVWLSAKHGRLYCNTICPVGALLGLLSKISLFQIRFDEDACTGCRSCETVCKAGCIDLENKRIDVSRCVGCYNCFAVCRKNGLRFETLRRPGVREVQGRRGFLLGLAAGITGTVVKAAAQSPPPPVVQSRPTTIPERITSPVSPPGSVSIDRFNATCTVCHLCVSACPSRVIVPSLKEFGVSGIMQPRMDFHSGHCNYECTICGQICPTGAILPLTVEKKKRIQLGVAKFIKENCVVYTDNTNCGACSEHCPTKAVNMVPYLNTPEKKLVIPEVNPDVCVGCGGCEYACPTKPYKAIYIDGNPVHKAAKKPEEKKIDQKVDYKKDFPF